MRMFLGLRVYVFLGVIFLFISGAAEGQSPSLQILGADSSGEFEVGETAEVIFLTEMGGGVPAVGVKLAISYSGIGDVSISNNGITDVSGTVTVRGTILRVGNTYIEADWKERDIHARAIFDVREPDLNPSVVLVVNPPDPQSPLSVGDTFTQVITIENRDRLPTLPLAAWQMDVVFNPAILKVVAATEGDFLKSDGQKTRYTQEILPDRIRVSQAREALASAGISLFPGDKGELVTITFRVLAVVEDTLGIHNVQLQSSEDFDRNGHRDRLEYSILVKGFSVVAPVLEVITDRHEPVYVGDEVTVTFKVSPADQVPLYVSAGNIRVISIEGESHHPTPILHSNYTTSSVGELVVRGIFTGPGNAYIQAQWASRAKTAVAQYQVGVPLRPAILTIVSGNNQSGRPNTRLQPFVVDVKDENSDPLPNIPVTFKVTLGSGYLLPTTAITNSAGQAQTTLTLGPNGGANWVVASVSDFPSLSQTFTAAATAADGRAEIVFRNYQNMFKRSDVHAFFPDVLSAFKSSAIQEVLSSAVINHFVKDPRYIRTIHPEVDDNIIVLLVIDDNFRQLFRDEGFHAVLQNPAEIDKLVHLIEASDPISSEDDCEIPPSEDPKAATLLIVSGYGQVGGPGDRLASPFVVEVRDQYGNPFSGATVTFRATQGGGSLSPTTALTNGTGRAHTTLTLGPNAGANWVVASVSGISLSQTFTATAVQPEAPLPPSVYYIDDGVLYRSMGGQKEILLKPRSGTLTGGLAVDMVRRKIYWTEQMNATTGKIRSAALDGTEVRLMATVGGVPYGVAVGTDRSGERRVYWTTSRGTIQRINVDGSGFRQNLISGLNSPRHIAFDEVQHKLYWTETGRIRSANPNGTKKFMVGQGLGEFGGIAVADGVVYWTEQTGDGRGKIRSMDGNGSGVKLHAVLEDILGGIVIDPVGDKVYWMTSGGEVQSINFNDGRIRTVVDGIANPSYGIALESSASVLSSPAAPSVNLEDSVKNALLANYPNPFNPETWIPYQLSKASDVRVLIYSVNGALVRTLALGHQSAGTYRSRSRAAYWDGRNDFGERVASGVYFYTFTAGDFRATRKMLIRK